MKIRNNTIKIFFLLIWLFTYSQKNDEKEIDSIFYYIKKIKLEKAKRKVETSFLPEKLKNNFYWYLFFLKEGKNNTITFNKNFTSNNSKFKISNFILSGVYEFQSSLNDVSTFNKINKAKEIAIEKKDTLLVCQSYRELFYTIFNDQNKINDLSDFEFKQYKNFAYDDFEQKWYKYYYLRYISQKQYVSNINDFYKLLNEIDNDDKFIFLKARIQQFIGILLMYFEKDYKKSTKYYESAISNYKLIDIYYSNQYILENKINIGININRNGNYKDAINFMDKALKKEISHYEPHDYSITYNIYREAYENLGKIDSAYYYLKKKNQFDKINDTLTSEKQLKDLSIKYKTAEKEKAILQLEKNNLEKEKKNKQQKNLIIGSILFIVLGGTIAILSLKSSKRKRKLAEQEKELETQKNLTLLKEQELTTINAMVDGQEKERKRIAEDLHDNLGSVLATLKLHFENLQINKEKKKINQDKLFNKTESLIDEAYLKVRSIAHAKNAGVIANQGLLTAVQMMAEKISSADKINIEVIHFQLDKRLENSLEITVFRIIQELITNVIKHAEATNATINIAAYDKNLNIIVEDNGKGFNVKNINLKDGMGIGSIKTRIEHLKGTFDIDATIGRGSSIIIDIPIA